MRAIPETRRPPRRQAPSRSVPETPTELARLAAIVRSSHDAIVSTDAHRRITSWNPGAERLLGYPAEAIIGRSIDILLPGEPSPETLNLREQIGAGRAVENVEVERRHRDGRIVHLAVSVFPLEDPVGGITGAAIIARDIGDQRRAVHQIGLQAALLDQVDAAVIATDPDYRILSWSRGAERLYGWRAEEVIGVHAGDLLAAGPLIEGEPEAPSSLEPVEYVVELRHKDGRMLPVLVRQARFVYEHGYGIVGVSVDVTARRAAETERLRTTEFLRALTEHTAEGIVAVDAGGTLTFVNPAAADLLGCRPDALLGRNFHDAVHPPSLCRPEACSLLRGLRGTEVVKVEEERFARSHGVPKWVSYSCSPLLHGSEGRAVVVFRDTSERQAQTRRVQAELEALAWVGRIRDAIDEHRLVLHAQPIVDVRTGAVVLRELLLRMDDGRGGIIEPDRFLPTAERFGLIGEIDRWVAAEAARLAAGGLAVTFNVSAATLCDEAALAAVEAEIRAAGSGAASLVCEITETALARDITQIEQFAGRLAELGCRVALDDFGTGYGGFTYVKRLPVSYLKIDADFVRDLADNPASRHVVEAIARLAHGLGQRTIAEGVEDPALMEVLRAIGIDFAQGYAIARPGPLAE